MKRIKGEPLSHSLIPWLIAVLSVPSFTEEFLLSIYLRPSIYLISVKTEGLSERMTERKIERQLERNDYKE